MKARNKSIKDPKFYTVRTTVRCVRARRWRMTANQVAYWQLEEAKRHNRTEEMIKSSTQQAQEERFKSQSKIESFDAQTRRLGWDTQNRRVNVQNGVDIANAVTGGIRNVSQGASSLAGLFIGR